MSLDVSLVRKRWVSYDEGITHEEEKFEIYTSNITHNLSPMAGKAGIYEALWRPYKLNKEWKDNFFSDKEEYVFEDTFTVYAKDIIPKLEEGLKELKRKPEYFEEFNSPNGWGKYEHFVPFVEEYLESCKKYPESIVKVDR